jgi:hypothetical protein
MLAGQDFHLAHVPKERRDRCSRVSRLFQPVPHKERAAAQTAREVLAGRSP